MCHMAQYRHACGHHDTPRPAPSSTSPAPPEPTPPSNMRNYNRYSFVPRRCTGPKWLGAKLPSPCYATYAPGSRGRRATPSRSPTTCDMCRSGRPRTRVIFREVVLGEKIGEWEMVEVEVEVEDGEEGEGEVLVGKVEEVDEKTEQDALAAWLGNRL